MSTAVGLTHPITELRCLGIRFDIDVHSLRRRCFGYYFEPTIVTVRELFHDSRDSDALFGLSLAFVLVVHEA